MIEVLSMDGKLARFRQYVIKKIVNTVEYDSKKDEYIINRIHMSDATLNTILEEGYRYGLTKQESCQLISNISDKMIVSPSVITYKERIDIRTKFKVGELVTLHYQDDIYGKHYLELLYLGDYSFSVMSASQTGFRFNDIMDSIAYIWPNACYLYFVLKRNGSVFPHQDAIIRVGKILYVDIHKPSCVNEIIDSRLTFEKDEIEENTCAEVTNIMPTTNKSLNITYSWKWAGTNPIYFNPNDFCFDEHAPFILRLKEDGTGKLRINKRIIFPEEIYEKNKLLQTILRLCELRGTIKAKGHEIEKLKYIKNEKLGSVKSIIRAKECVWVVEEPPIIKFVYYE